MFDRYRKYKRRLRRQNPRALIFLALAELLAGIIITYLFVAPFICR